MRLRTLEEQKAYLDGYEKCAECIEQYLSDEGKKILELSLIAVRAVVESENNHNCLSCKYFDKNKKLMQEYGCLRFTATIDNPYEELRCYEEEVTKGGINMTEQINDIKVGDEIRTGIEGRNAITSVVHLIGDRGDCFVYQCITAGGHHHTCTSNDDIRKTGRHFPQIAEVLKQMETP